ncbi:MAG: hypothetical protein JRD02_00725 [Deltaproteobacteria bacterium]|nr:hypothetical protein [Deltaproteobacteria bacterium]
MTFYETIKDDCMIFWPFEKIAGSRLAGPEKAGAVARPTILARQDLNR